MKQRFPPGVVERLQYYVYRLVDPRNGETFYVGKGKGDRVFQHANGSTKLLEAEMGDPKLERIRQINNSSGLQVQTIIHRHGIEDEGIALLVEAAVMDCYPGLTNRVEGHGTDDYGVAHTQELIALYGADELVAHEPLLAISIAGSINERASVYEAVRFAWVLDVEKAREIPIVLAHVRGLVKGVFRPRNWFEATAENFPEYWDRPGRWGFEGVEAEKPVRDHYLGKRIPDAYRLRGAANPVRYIAYVKTPKRKKRKKS